MPEVNPHEHDWVQVYHYHDVHPSPHNDTKDVVHWCSKCGRCRVSSDTRVRSQNHWRVLEYEVGGRNPVSSVER